MTSVTDEFKIQPSVLVVDDEPMVRRVVTSAVTELAPKQVFEAEDGLQAQEVLRGESIDIVITDVNMPNMDGLELLKWGQPHFPSIKWIVLSSLETFDAAVEALKHGAFDYLSKPPERQRVQVAVRNSVDQLQLEADRERLYSEVQEKNATLAEQLEQLAGLCRMLEDQAEVIEADLKRAAVIQRALLPETPPKLDGWSLQTLYQPGTMVGGDFYDVVPLGVRYFGIVIADAAGQGVAAAMLSVLFKHALRLRDMDGIRPPAKVLASANRQIHADVSAPGVFVTAAYALVDRRQGTVRLASAGHAPIIHIDNNGQKVDLIRTGPALGLTEDASYEEMSLNLAEGDRLLFYTDGILNGATHENLLTQIPDDDNGEVFLDTLAGSHAGDARGELDDVTLVLLERSDGGSRYRNISFEKTEAQTQTHVEREAPLLTNGTKGDHAYMQISGRATWMRSTIFYQTAKEMLSAQAVLSIDLRDCEYLDSTFLGTIHEIVSTHADQVSLQRVPDNILALFEELSMQAVLNRSNVSVDPLPVTMTPLTRSVDEHEQSERLLKAHEVLATLSDENEEQFKSVVAALRADLGEG